MSAVNFRPLSELMPPQNTVPGWGSNDHDSVDRQLEASLEFDAKRDWIEIATSPEDARRIITSGRLAMILAIEISDLFPEGDWLEQLDHYYEMGVRSIQLAHQLDNRFTGVAPHHFIFRFFQIVEDIRDGDWASIGFELDEDGLNVMGLTDEGKDLIRAMMDRNMIIDLSHLSERSIRDIYEIAKEYNYYPLVLSHGHFRSIMTEDKQKEEKTTPDWVVKVIKETGGMFGLRTGSLPVRTYSRSGVPNDCDGSTKSFAQIYQYGVKGVKVNVAFASDMNGYIQQIRPRFGGRWETCNGADDLDNALAQQELQEAKLGTDFDTKGFAHIGLIGDILKELKNFGVDTSNLEQSSENFIQVWERCYDPDRNALPTGDFDTSGIE
jgi:microsomal dipeptidase-like Zn-dependent dipeptidase